VSLWKESTRFGPFAQVLSETEVGFFSLSSHWWSRDSRFGTRHASLQEDRSVGGSMSATAVLTVGKGEYILDSERVFSLAAGLADCLQSSIGEYGGGYVPATVIRCDEFGTLGDALGSAIVRDSAGEGEIEGQERLLDAAIKWCRGRDDEDVWTEDFLGVIILMGHVEDASSEISQHLTHDGRTVLHVDIDSGKETVTSGPYIVHAETRKVYSVRRLFPDVNDCFVRGAVPCPKVQDRKEHQAFRWLTTTDHIAVPSRLHHPPPSSQKPLSGLRFGVKDVIDIAGLETGCGSANYRNFYPARTQTAACIQRLVDAGAVMVGKMRCCQWCDGQDPMERHEEPTPINPRGDLFQKPSGSSSGSAAGAASYLWLDFNIGTDTGGSIRHPAAVNGLYGIRPSLGSVDSAGLVCSKWTDTTGVFARSARIARDTMAVLMDPQWRSQRDFPSMDMTDGRKKYKDKYKYKLLYAVNAPDDTTNKFFPPNGLESEAQTPASQHLETFVSALEKHLNCKRQEVCIPELWTRTHPPDAVSVDLTEATENIYQNVVYRDLAKHTVQPFVQEFKGKNAAGRRPYIEPSTRARLEYGSNLPDAEYEASVEALKVFGGWVNEHLLPAPSNATSVATTGQTRGTTPLLSHSSLRATTDEEQLTTTITIPLLVYPVSRGTPPRYRDEFTPRAPGSNIFWTGFSTYGISYCSGCPDFTLPVGEVEFHSRVTDTVEKLPVAISLMGPKGADEVMLELIAELEEAGVLQAVKCGKSLW